MQAIEEVCSRHSPDVMLGYFNITKYNVVLRHLGIPYLSLAPVKFHSRYLWSDDEYITSREFVEKVKEYAADPLDEGFTIPEYAQVDASAYLFKKLKVGYLSKIHQALRIAEDELKKLVFRRRPENAYRFMGWVWPVLRYPGMYGYMMKHGVVPDDLRGSRVVFFPLHYEPEVALMSFSPEVNNSYEVISWLSKSVPSDTYVVIKEQPHMFGMRSKWYYDLYRKMGNVAFARPDVTSWEWIRRCDVASTITGTVATESVFFEKPLLSFNTHNIVNLLPSVRVASNYEETRRGLDDLLQLTDRAVLKKSRYALCRALLDVSFDLPEFTSYMKKNAIPEALAQTAAQALHDHYPAIFRGEA